MNFDTDIDQNLEMHEIIEYLPTCGFSIDFMFIIDYAIKK